ncbi:TonB-dependent receptor [Granulicella sp. WH15]|uniref:TonB-dependent receptor n=1 Tax=Granulicella sp. WH15 TaxID=2602070 RepID=UPI001367946A|nr:carboxypeptidase regulatory-like domain-containing protein [Granulicella sp. WH15]QHN02596.1 TonB-dependent receptor [Granulicella sp. WH15]
MKKLFLLFLLSVLPALAQTDRASLTGSVTDPSGRRVVGAHLVITSENTDTQRLTDTNQAGAYTVSSLATGAYTVAINAPGFSPYVLEGVTLDVGQTRTLDAKLAIEGTSTQVEVLDSGLSKSSAEIGGVVHGKQAQDLSLNGRSFVGLVSLVPGVIDGGTGTQQDVRFAGLSDEDNTWHLDGVDNSGINHQYQKVDLHLQVSTEAIAEFRANGVGYSADQGGSVGGQIEVVSKTGGAQFHGAAWEFIRNNYFDATPWGAAGFLPALRRNNYGANLGGPILKKKLFFFANYEAVREILNKPITGTVPTASFRAQVASQQPVLAPLINAYPLGQIAISPTSATYNGTGKQITREDSGLIRGDYHVSDRMSVFVRVNTDHYTQTAPDNLPPATGFNNLNTPNATIGVQNTFTQRFFNDFRYGFNRAQFLQGQNTPFAFALSISPFTSIGNPSGSIRNDNSFTGIDDATFLFGRHTIKAGVTVRRVQENKASPNSPDETISYTSTSTFLSNLIDSDSYNGTVPLTGQRLTEYFGYVLDQYKLGSTVNLNIGLRYEYFGVNHEVLGRGISVDPLNCPNIVCPSNIGWYSPNLLDLSPRISGAWSPELLHGKTVFRAGFGIYYGFGQFGGLGTPISNITPAKYTLTQAQSPGLSYPVPPTLGTQTGSSSPSGAPINRRDTAVDEWTISVQQEIAKQTIFQMSYFGTSASHVFSDWTLNGIIPATGKRPYAGYSTIDYRGTFNHASTNAFQTSLQRNVSRELSLSANYEWSHSIDNGGLGGGEADVPQNVACPRCERAASDQDMRSYFTGSAIWQLPFGRGRKFLNTGSRTADFFLGGWQLSTIAYARGGLPLNVTVSRSASALPDQINKSQRPNVVLGVPLYFADKTPQHWLNYEAFSTPANGTWGNLGRNAVRGPAHWQIDPAISKRFPITERVGTTFRAEAFNILNKAQYGKPATTWAPATTVPNPNNFGVITSAYNTNTAGSGGPRDLQFSLKVDF